MIRAATGDRPAPTDFIRTIRFVADARHVSVHDILSPAPVITHAYHAGADTIVERIRFDQAAGWSWREVLVWACDAARQGAERSVASNKADWQRDGALPDYADSCEPPADEAG